jgi:hypothetical protein
VPLSMTSSVGGLFATGTFYLYEPQPIPILLARRLLFWAVLILTPVAILQFCSASPWEARPA